MTQGDQRLTAKQAARELEVTVSAVKQMCLRGVFPNATQVGEQGMWRIPWDDVIKYEKDNGDRKPRRTEIAHES